jgi:hypothetical protein
MKMDLVVGLRLYQINLLPIECDKMLIYIVFGT